MLVRTILQEKGRWVATVPHDTTVDVAVELLDRNGIGALVVTEADGRTVGIISERDIVRDLALHGSSTLSAAVTSLMTSQIHTCGLDDTADDLMAIMTERRIRHLPVIDGGVLVGIVSIGDVVKHRVHELQLEAKTLHDYLETGR